MNSILNENLILKGKKVILRVDLNVPMQNGSITEVSRITKILPTIKLLIKKEAKVIVLSHIGRPKGKVVKGMSLEPISKKLADLLNKEVLFNKNEINDKTLTEINKISNGSIMMMENIRFYEKEEKNDDAFSKKISGLGDMYVNDAFSCSHRSHASIDQISKFLPSFSGLQLDLEINALNKITAKITKPITCIIGGSKISTKINIIKNLLPKFDNIIIVGGMANNFIEYFGNNIGKSIKEENCVRIVEEILSLSKKKECKIIYPEDVLVSKNLNGSPKNKDLDQILPDEMILDIGPKTINKIVNIIGKSKTILWNGPAGYFENPNFANGSIKIAKKIIEYNKSKNIFSVVGGGDTVSFINSLNVVKEFNFVSTAGGAFLEYLEGKELPGISALN